MQLKSFVRPMFYVNNVDALIPEFWVNESLAVLEESLVAAGLVHRDFEDTLAKKGDTVNCNRPARLEPYRKDTQDNVTVQDVSSESIPVVLDQHIHTSFLIRDGEESKSMKDLIAEFIVPAMKGNARFLDRIVLGQYSRFLHNQVGKLGGLTSATAKDYLIEARKKAENLLWPDEERRPLIHNPYAEAEFLKTELFHSAEKLGDDGTALRTASLGKKFGFDNLQTQQMAYITETNTRLTGAINNAAGYPAGTTVLAVDTFVGAVTTGSFVKVDGNVHRITAHTETLGNTTSITITPALPQAVADNAVVVAYTPGAVNNAGGYAAGWQKAIVVDGFTVAPQVGQTVTFTSAPQTIDDFYTIIGKDVSTTSITLDRPLKTAIADNAPVNIGPAGSYSFSFLKEAIALVVRPLAMPKAGAGALSAVSNFNDLSMRATITYDGNKQGHLVTLDFLCGIAVLNSNMGLVLLG